MKKALAYGVRVGSSKGDRLLYASKRPISADKEKRLMKEIFGADARIVARRIAKAEKIHRSCEE